MPSRKADVSPLQSVVAGGVAGGIESIVTYPTEFVKTRQQLLSGPSQIKQSPLHILLNTFRKQGLSHLYTGGGAFCVSNASKSGVRFLTFDLVRSSLPKDGNGKVSVMGNLISGLAAGISESVAVLTPGENLKTKLIDDRAGPRMYRSTTHAIQTMLRTEGVSGFYRGVWPVSMKQSANAMVRFTSYNYLLDLVKPLVSTYGVGGSASAVAGAMAGVITVYCTMPFDNIKTQLQSLEGKQMYTGSIDCAEKLIASNGIQRLWKGTTPRLARLSISGAISFSVYEQVVALTEGLRSESNRGSALL